MKRVFLYKFKNHSLNQDILEEPAKDFQDGPDKNNWNIINELGARRNAEQTIVQKHPKLKRKSLNITLKSITCLSLKISRFLTW